MSNETAASDFSFKASSASNESRQHSVKIFDNLSIPPPFFLRPSFPYTSGIFLFLSLGNFTLTLGVHVPFTGYNESSQV